MFCIKNSDLLNQKILDLAASKFYYEIKTRLDPNLNLTLKLGFSQILN